MSEADSRSRFSEILDRVQQEDGQVIIEKDGMPVAAIVPMSVVRDAEAMERRRQELREALRATRDEFRTIPPDQIEREIARAISDVEETRRRNPGRDDPTTDT